MTDYKEKPEINVRFLALLETFQMEMTLETNYRQEKA